MKNFIKNNWIYIFILVTLVLYTLTYNTIDMDYWARLLQGNAFWQLGHILKTDPFSYTPTHLWLDHEWGSSVIFSFINNIAGFKGILIFKTILIFSMFLLIFKTIELNSKNNNLAKILLFLIAISAMPTILHSGLRCHFFTFFFFSLFLYLLEYIRKYQKFKLLYLLPIIMIFWSNIHGGCVSGLGLLFIYSLGEYLNKKAFKPYILTLLASTLALFINPYGFEYVKFIFMATTMKRPFVTEWISAFSHPYWNFMFPFKAFFVISTILFIYSLKNKNRDYTKLITLVLCTYLSFKYVKNTPFIVIVSTIFFYDLICKFIEKICTKEIVYKGLMVVLIGFSLFINTKKCIEYLNYSFLSEQPIKVVEFININNIKGKIVAPFDMCSYISYKLYPNNLIYMDGRYEEVYFKGTKDLLDNFYNVQKDGYKILEGENKPDLIIVPTNALLNDYLQTEKAYKLIYQDVMQTLYVETKQAKDNYIMPTDDISYYEKSAFDTKLNYRDDVTINGEKVIFK